MLKGNSKSRESVSVLDSRSKDNSLGRSNINDSDNGAKYVNKGLK